MKNKLLTFLKNFCKSSFRITRFSTPDAPKDYDIIEWGEGKANAEKIPKIVWIYWNSKELPITIKTSLLTIEKHFKGYEIRLLDHEAACRLCSDLNNLDFLSPPNLSDYLRLFLLKEFGGIWIDASTLFTMDIETMFDFNSGFDLYCIFCNGYTSNRERPILETYFLASPKGGKFITDWFEEYKKCVFSSDPDHYYFSFMENPENGQAMDKSRWAYLKCFSSAMYVMAKNNDYKVFSISSHSLPLFYFDNHNDLHHNFRDTLLLNKINSNLPGMIKITSAHRNALEESIANGVYRHDSLFVNISSKENFTPKDKIKRLWHSLF